MTVQLLVLYAFDVDSASSTPLWLTNFTNPPSVTAVPMSDVLPVNGSNVIGNLGVQGTPVIDAWLRTGQEIQPSSNGAGAPDGPTVWVGAMLGRR